MMRLTVVREDDEPVTFDLLPDQVTILGLAVYDADRVGFVLRNLPHPAALRLRIGDGVDPRLSEAQIYPDEVTQGCQTYRADWAMAKHFLQYAGRCTVSVDTVEEEPRSVAVFELLVQPSRLTQQEYHAILKDLQQRERGLLLDVYGKTYLTVDELSPSIPSEMPAEEFLAKARQAVTVFERELVEMRRHPQQGFRVSLTSRPYRAGQSLRPREVTALCLKPDGIVPAGEHDPSTLQLNGRPVAIDRVSGVETVTDFDVYEHRAIRWFLQRLMSSVGQLQRMALAEYEHRMSERSWKDYRRNPDKPSWWEEEDLPRLQPLLERGALCDSLAARINRLLRRSPCLQDIGPFRPPLVSTATFARRPAYRRIFQVMTTLHQVSGAIRFHGVGEQLRARDLTKLFEYWCAFRVLGELSRRFKPISVGAEQFFDTYRFVVQLKPDSEAWFRTGDGRYVRFRYEPRYRTRDATSDGYGRLHGRQTLFTPDIAVEVFRRQSDRIPELIYVFDAKYARQSTGAGDPNIDKAYAYLDGIGQHQGRGTPLVQHSWLLLPGELRADWYVDFDSPEDFATRRFQPGEIATVGAIPLNPGGDRLSALFDRLCQLDDIAAFGYHRQVVS